MKEIENRVKQQEKKEKDFIKKYGHVRKIVHCNTDDFKCVAVGKTLLWNKEWVTFPDFLMDYLKLMLGKKWWESNINKPESEQHQIIKWYKELLDFQKKQTKNKDGIFYSRVNSSMLSYILLAYDLYTIAHNNELQETIIHKLKNKQGFQGALYELFVTAVFIRADFDINYSNKKDRSKKHPEFFAENTNNGQLIAVEAKSRHRKGLLGMQGETPSNVKLDITKKINDALKKDPKYPFIIFIDLNLPKYKKNQHKNFQQLISEFKKSYNQELISEKFNFIFFTDHHPYSLNNFSYTLEFTDPIVAVSNYPSYNIVNNDLILSKLKKSISQFGNIPNDFSEMDFDNIIEI